MSIERAKPLVRNYLTELRRGAYSRRLKLSLDAGPENSPEILHHKYRNAPDLSENFPLSHQTSTALESAAHSECNVRFLQLKYGTLAVWPHDV